VVDVAALAERLRAGRLGGAVLDVHDPEPLPPDSPLWDVPNLILTPHVSSDDDVSYIPKTLDLVFDNLDRLLAGRPLRNRVRPALGY
jgi:phosphoglycerate dehydrogenase-like enzyme